MKAGYKTTEFWFTLVAVILGAGVETGVFPTMGTFIKVIALITTVLSVYGYNYQRTLQKSKTSE